MSLSYQHHSHFCPIKSQGEERAYTTEQNKQKTNIAYETIVEFNKKPPVSRLTVLVVKSLEGIEHVKNRNYNQDIGR